MAEYKYAYTADKSNPAGGDFANESGLFNGWVKMTSKLQGGTITNTAGVEVNNFAGWTSSVTLGLKSDLVIGSYIFPAYYKCTIGGDYSMQRGQKKDKSWGDKNEWRKGGITLRLNGEKKEFATNKNEEFQLGEKVINSNKKTSLVNLLSEDFFRNKEYTKVQEYNKIVKEQTVIAFNVERTAKSDTEYATGQKRMLSANLDVGVVDSIITSATRYKLKASQVQIKGTIELGGVVIPNPSLAAKLAKAEAARAAAAAKMDILIAKAKAKLIAIKNAEEAREVAAQVNANKNLAAAGARAV